MTTIVLMNCKMKNKNRASFYDDDDDDACVSSIFSFSFLCYHTLESCPMHLVQLMLVIEDLPLFSPYSDPKENRTLPTVDSLWQMLVGLKCMSVVA